MCALYITHSKCCYFCRAQVYPPKILRLLLDFSINIVDKLGHSKSLLFSSWLSTIKCSECAIYYSCTKNIFFVCINIHPFTKEQYANLDSLISKGTSVISGHLPSAPRCALALEPRRAPEVNQARFNLGLKQLI